MVDEDDLWLFNVAWKALARKGRCDGYKGAEYRRVKRLWNEMKRPMVELRSFIIKYANGVLDDNEHECPECGDIWLVPLCICHICGKRVGQCCLTDIGDKSYCKECHRKYREDLIAAAAAKLAAYYEKRRNSKPKEE